MSYIDKILRPEEKVLAIGRMHWIVFVQGTLLILVALVLLLWPAERFWAVALRLAGGVFLIYGLVNLGRNLIEAWTTEIAVTNLRVIHKRGLIRRETGEMNMEKVESVIVDQSIPGRLLDYGSIVVRGTGAGIEGLHHIANPLKLRSAIVVR